MTAVVAVAAIAAAFRRRGRGFRRRRRRLPRAREFQRPSGFRPEVALLALDDGHAHRANVASAAMASARRGREKINSTNLTTTGSA
eukprot:29638-Pelagococcus_subviridis.AAC.1